MRTSPRRCRLPRAASVGKGLVKAPRVDVREGGLLHALFGVPGVQALQGHPAAGPSWEGFVVEQVAAALPPGAQLACYRAAAGGELDLIVASPADGWASRSSSRPRRNRSEGSGCRSTTWASSGRS